MDTPKFHLLVGLGNPGREYQDTRHNVGFMVLDRMAANVASDWRKERSWKAMLARNGPMHLCKPLTYMNLSGEAVKSVCSFHRIPPAEILVIYDDTSLPLGKIRLRSRGSAGGHNGMKSIIAHLGTEEFARLRIGIGASEPGSQVDHVLGRFSAAEQPILDEAIGRTLDAVAVIQTQGLEAAMNRFNA